jgi:hypothetical protein
MIDDCREADAMKNHNNNHHQLIQFALFCLLFVYMCVLFLSLPVLTFKIGLLAVE